jgi:hypothetical protein
MSSIIEETVAKAVGRWGALKASISGLEGIFPRLAAEHDELALLMGRAEMTSDPQKRAELWAKIKPFVQRHERCEKVVLYAEPSIATFEGVVDLHVEETERIWSLLEAVEQAPFESAQWEASFKQFQDLVLIHARHEEALFIRMQELIGAQRARELEDVYLKQVFQA